jgi:hypothetical protein
MTQALSAQVVRQLERQRMSYLSTDWMPVDWRLGM